jgi:hypothetical protein
MVAPAAHNWRAKARRYMNSNELKAAAVTQTQVKAPRFQTHR